MRILYLPAYTYPERVAGSHLSKERNVAFVENGMTVDIVAPTPCRGLSMEEIKQYKNIRSESFHDGQINIFRFRMYREGKNPILRALRYTFCWIRQLFAGFSRKYDLVLIGSTPPIQGTIGAFLSKLRKKPFVFILQDIFPDSLVGTGLAKKNGVLWKIGNRISNFTYKHADKIIVISQDFKRNIMTKGVPEEKIEVIYNWVDENAIVPVKDEDNELFEEFGISRDKFRVVYAGNLGNAQNIGIIVEAAKRLKDNDNIEFVIFGTGGLEDEIKATKEKEQLDNLKILPLQPYERVAKVYGLGNVCIVACKAGLGGAAMPSKTWSIMSAGRAVLANFDEGELKEILENNHCGVFTKADDLEGFVGAIEELSQHLEQCTEMGMNGRRFILENLTREVGTRKYVEVIRSVANKS